MLLSFSLQGGHSGPDDEDDRKKEVTDRPVAFSKPEGSILEPPSLRSELHRAHTRDHFAVYVITHFHLSQKMGDTIKWFSGVNPVMLVYTNSKGVCVPQFFTITEILT